MVVAPTRRQTGRAAQRGPGNGEHHGGRHQDEQDAPHQPCAAQVGQPGTGGQQCPRLGEPACHRLRRRPGQARDRATAPARSRHPARSARSGQHSRGGIAHQAPVAPAHRDQVLGTGPDPARNGWPVNRRAGGSQCRPRAGGKASTQRTPRSADRAAKRASAGGAPWHDRRAAGRRPAPGRAGPRPPGRRLSPARRAAPPPRQAVREVAAHPGRGPPAWRSRPQRARGPPVCRCSSAVKPAGPPGQGWAGVCVGHVLQRRERVLRQRPGLIRGCAPAAAAAPGATGLQLGELPARAPRFGRLARRRRGSARPTADRRRQARGSRAGQPRQQMRGVGGGGERGSGTGRRRRFRLRFRGWQGGRFTHRSSASIAS